MSGSSRTGIDNNEATPATTISRLATIANTGRRIDKSDSVIATPCQGQHYGWTDGTSRLQSSSRHFAGVWRFFHALAAAHPRTVAHLLNAAYDNLRAVLDAFENFDMTE